MAKRKNMVLPALLIILVCFGIGFGIGTLLGHSGVKNGVHHITVCETTDVHGAYFSRSYDGRQVRTSMSNVSSYIKSLRKEGLNPVVIDNGDNLQGDDASYYYNFVAKDERHVFPRIAEFIGYDALVLGNHDLETGHEVYDRLRNETKIPYIAANAICVGGPDDGEPYFQPYVIVKRNKVKIAVIGMTNAYVKHWISDEKYAGMDFLRISDVAQAWVDEVIAKERPHLVIVAMHSGAGSEEGSLENEALYLARTLKGVDAILCGHDHRATVQEVDNPQGKVLLVNGGPKATFVTQCDFDLTFKGGKVVDKTSSCKMVEMVDYPKDQEYDAAFEDSFNKVYNFSNEEIGSIKGDLYFGDALRGPSPYLNLIHTVQLDATGSDISIAAPLSTTGKVTRGPVTFKSLVDIYQYENLLFAVELTGRQIKDYLEFSYDLWVNNSGPTYNFDSAAGIIYTVSRSAAKGERVDIQSMADGTPFDLDKTYKVALNSYRASGGGEHVTSGAGVDPDSLVILEKLGDIRSLIGEYIKKTGDITPDESENWKFVK